MSTATEVAELEALLLSGEEPETSHAICGSCWPNGVIVPGVTVALCGYVLQEEDTIGYANHKCARCLAIDSASPLPCGHP